MNVPVHRIIEWDVRNWSRCLSFWEPLVQRFNPAEGSVLALGERHGGIALWFALRGFHVTCSDLGGPTAKARELHSEFGVSARVTYADVDMFSMPYPAESFDIVACKSVIGGLKKEHKNAATRTLENQAAAVREIRRVLKPSGCFLGAENLTGSLLHEVMRAATKGSRLGWRYPTQRELGLLFADFASIEIEPFGFFGTRTTKLGVDRVTGFLDRLLSPILPKRWLYIAFLRAQKATA
jgi:SAM-dependent methyltransferase